ncbi:glycosyltransferase family 2 protein [Rhodoferax sp.]|uniref:glycosyltransferase family 2 protein n=1 Tax=Rhodoferax sp. TaxID=50421 RepID=UPI00261AFE63|nr:glycosyltransferase family 2 protein [Rhodoferax sp.]MDD2919833.1 glycosyltransferase family 2 protein [Rhodoferax sp.]
MQALTAPLRVFRRMRLAMARLGGLSNTVAATLQILRQEGLAGAWHRIRINTTPPPAVPAPGSGEFDRNDYAEWTLRYDTLTDDVRANLRARASSLASQPLISVIMPVYNPKPKWLTEAIESVRQQIYPHWELCIADDASTDPRVRTLLQRYTREDARIKLIVRAQNGHICAASNSALQLATGAWIALLDHDDLLREHALFWVADAINRHPEARLIYSDEDKIDPSGQRSDPYFKCDWNVDLFHSQNMISHLGVYDAPTVRAVGGFRPGLEGSQDYDLALRCIERMTPRQIHHIPRVLYHWRAHADSTALSGSAKPYAVLAGERALNEHFERQHTSARAEFAGCGYRVRYALPAALPLVSLIMPTKNALALLQPCVASLISKTSYANYELLIVDNGSDDPATLDYLDALKAEPRVRVLRDNCPFNYSALNNAAVSLARGELVALLNNDLEVISPDWLSEMVGLALQAGVGAVGARLWYPDNTLQHAGVVLGLDGVAGHAQKRLGRSAYGYFSRACLAQGFSAVTAACLVIRKAIYQEVGGLNETDLAVAFNDVDFCLRVREAGYRNVWTPFAELYHHESASRGHEDTPEKQARFNSEVQYMKQRWGELLLTDPAYNPNLTLIGTDFSLAWPPRVASLA